MSGSDLLFGSRQQGAFVLNLADSETPRLLDALARADSVMRSMSPADVVQGRGTPGGIFRRVVGSPAPVGADQPYFEFQVEKQVRAAPDSPQPEYPQELKAEGIEGEVLAQFVVDTNGKARPETLKLLRSSRQEFSEALRQAVPRMVFIPAEIGGRKVPQVVQQPFVFTLRP